MKRKQTSNGKISMQQSNKKKEETMLEYQSVVIGQKWFKMVKVNDSKLKLIWDLKIGFKLVKN